MSRKVSPGRRRWLAEPGYDDRSAHPVGRLFLRLHFDDPELHVHMKAALGARGHGNDVLRRSVVVANGRGEGGFDHLALVGEQ